jgi:hypothetical protein
MSLTPQPFPAPPRRPSYHTGMLLDAEDFRDEQGYHRGQLARLARWLHGQGTVCGLEVKHFPAGTEGHAEETLAVRPGVAIDRLGRLIEVRRTWCLRLSRWFDHTVAAQPDLAPKREPDDRRDLLADVFLRFLEAPRGLRPAFPEAAADATDALVASRLEDAFELVLVPRMVEANTEPKLPDKPFAPPPADRAAFLEKLFAAYEPPVDDPANLPPLPEHPADFDRTAVFLARVRLRLLDHPATALTRHATGAVSVDNLPRRIAPTAVVLFALTPLD